MHLLAAAAIIGVALALAGALAGAFGLLPAPLPTVVATAGSGGAIAVLLVLRRRGAAAALTPRTRRIVELGMLGVAVMAMLAGYITTIARTGDDEATATHDLQVHACLLLVLVALALPARTLGWRPILGSLTAGFLGSIALARALGTPVIDAIGPTDLATAVWVPITEELVKALPVLIVALLALRDRTARPAAVDLAVLGAASGAGFALMENLQYGRAWGDWSSAPPLSLLLPTIEHDRDTGASQYIAGHAIWTALVCLGLGVGLLYRHRRRLALLAIPAAFLLAVLEHGMINAEQPPAALGVLLAHGLLSPIVLLLGFGAMVVVERRPLRGPGGMLPGLLLRSPGLALHRAALARRQGVAR
jgi:RsiW-degrading membrane proteinase PrsW (M82 family)